MVVYFYALLQVIKHALIVYIITTHRFLSLDFLPTFARILKWKDKDMTNMLARLKIIVRIYLLIFVATIGIVSVVLISGKEIQSALYEAKATQTETLVAWTHSLIASYVERAKKGELTEDEAKKQALKAVSGLRYDKTNYFGVNDWDSIML